MIARQGVKRTGLTVWLQANEAVWTRWGLIVGPSRRAPAKTCSDWVTTPSGRMQRACKHVAICEMAVRAGQAVVCERALDFEVWGPIIKIAPADDGGQQGDEKGEGKK